MTAAETLSSCALSWPATGRAAATPGRSSTSRPASRWGRRTGRSWSRSGGRAPRSARAHLPIPPGSVDDDAAALDTPNRDRPGPTTDTAWSTPARASSGPSVTSRLSCEISMFLRDWTRSVRCSSAVRTAAGISTLCTVRIACSVGLIVRLYTSSSGPLASSRFRFKSAVCHRPRAASSICSATATCASDCTVSIGAIVPISTLMRLSWYSRFARSSARCPISICSMACFRFQ